MSPSERADTMRKAATALDVWAKVEWWGKTIHSDDTEKVTIEWQRGASVGGYTEIADEVERIVSERWGALIQEAASRIKARTSERLTDAGMPPLEPAQ